MADFEAIKTEIQNNIDTNGNQEITGAVLQDTLIDMIDATEDEIAEKAGYFINPDSWEGIPRFYEEGLLEFYLVADTFPDIAGVDMWCYGPRLYIRWRNSSNQYTYIISGMSFDSINNLEQIDIIVNGENCGYVIFKDKQKFIDNPAEIGMEMNLKKVLRGIPPIADDSVTIPKTNFITLLNTGIQLYDKSSMGVVGSWYYWRSASGIGNGVALITNQYTEPYTAIKIPINGLEKITLSQVEDGVQALFSYYIVDENMIALDFAYSIGATLTSGYTIDTGIEGAAYLLLSVRNYNENYFMANEGSVALPYEPYREDTLVNGVNISKKDTIEISLPDKIYAIVGDTLQLFYRGIIQAVNPYNYNIVITCSKGNQYPRYFEYRPTSADVGETFFAVTVKNNNGDIIKTKACTLVTRNVVQSPSSITNVACFGDSLTSAGTWCAEAYRRLTQTGGTPAGKGLENINFVGSKTNGGAGYFGVGGWTWYSYLIQGALGYRFQVQNVSSLSVGAEYTNNGNTFTIKEVNITEGGGNILCSVTSLTPAPTLSGVLTKASGTGDDTISFTSVEEDVQNPLWDVENNKMSFIPYANEVAGGDIDVVYTLLSWNGLTAWKDDFESIINQVKTFADTLHSEFPNAKMKIMGLEVPSVRGGMGANYGATGTSYADWFGMVVTALNMNKAYQDFANEEGYSDFVEFVNVSSQFDTEYNMPHTQKNVNTRNSDTTEWMDTNGVHPANVGYLQIADVVYRNFIANFCQ